MMPESKKQKEQIDSGSQNTDRLQKQRRKEITVKKRIFVPIIMMFILALAGLVSAEPQFMYADRDQVKVYQEKDRESKVLKTLKGGEKVLLEQMTEDLKWGAMLCQADDGNGQQLGWFEVENMSFVMPSRYCDHQWTDWTVYEEATCTHGGMMERSCPICGIGEAVDTDPLPHTFGDWTVTKEATCTEEGERVHTCTVCGTQEKQTIERKPHTFGDWKVTKEATCKAEGERVHTCTVCKTEEKQAIEKLPHDFEQKILVEATDHSAGVKQRICKKCGYAEDKVSFDPEGTLRRGDKGEAVYQMQQLLADQNFLNDDGADGIFGGGTEQALMKFQKAHGLTPDGVAWPQTLKRLQHQFGEWKVTAPLTREKAGERTRVCKDCGYEQHEVIELVPSLVYGQRGEDVRTVQQMLEKLGHDAGTCDGIYGQKLDAAFESFAKSQKPEIKFEAGKILPVQIDALVNAWIAATPDDLWTGDNSLQGNLDSPVNLALTVTPVQEGFVAETGSIMTYNWNLTNLGTEDCYFTALLLNFGEEENKETADTKEAANTAEAAAAEKTAEEEKTAETAETADGKEVKIPDFRKNNIVLVIDGSVLKANGANSASGSIKVSKDWSEKEIKNMFFTALAVSESTGASWLSNIIH